MSDETIQYVSQEKFDALKKELAQIKEMTIPGLAKRIDDARQMGDLSENAEYHAAREEMAWAQSQSKEIEHILSNAQIQGMHTATGYVSIGSTLTANVSGKTRQFTIVGAQEADPIHGKISNESPLGQAFMGKKAGDTVQVTVPAGVQVYEITEVK